MNFYGMLMQFTRGTTPCREHLLKSHSADLIDAAIQLGYIREIHRNAYDDPVYMITDLGKNVRDK